MIQRLVVKPLTVKAAYNKSPSDLKEYVMKEKEKFRILQKRIKEEKAKYEESLILKAAGGKALPGLMKKTEMLELENDALTIYQNIMKATARFMDIKKWGK